MLHAKMLNFHAQYQHHILKSAIQLAAKYIKNYTNAILINYQIHNYFFLYNI